MSRNQRMGTGLAAGIFTALSVAFVVIALVITSYAKTESVQFTLTNKESVAVEGGHEYRLYTSAGTFKVGDSIVHPRFDSADLYGRLVNGQTYDCKVYGWRVGLLSMFKNVLDCDPVVG